MKVTDWKELFSAIGVSEDAMNQWHSLFEQKFPDDHQSFLEWLNFDADRIAQIRTGK